MSLFPLSISRQMTVSDFNMLLHSSLLLKVLVCAYIVPYSRFDVLYCPARFLPIALSKVDSKLIFVWVFNGSRE